jgi:hypothetical protein
MEAPDGGLISLISLFSHKVHSFFGELGASATSHNAYTFKQTEGYRCFNDLIDTSQQAPEGQFRY